MVKAGYSIHDEEIAIDLPKEGHMRKAVDNRGFVSVKLDRMTAHAADITNLKQKALAALSECLDLVPVLWQHQ